MKTRLYQYKIFIPVWIIYLLSPAMAYVNADENNRLEIGFENAELAQNKYRNLGPSNYTFFIGKKFESELLKNWAWRFSSINVELSNEHLNEVCCINGDRSNLVGNLEQHRLYFNYLPSTISWASNKNKVSVKLISSLSIGYNRWITKDIVANEEHDVKAITIGGLFSVKTTFYDRFFIEPALDLGFIISKNKNVNNTVGSATIDRPENISYTLMTYFGYIFD